MPSVSSPISYPQSSSPPVPKRPRPVKSIDIRKPKAVSGFLIEEDSDENDFLREEPAPKRRMLESSRSQSPDNSVTGVNKEGAEVELQLPAVGESLRGDLGDSSNQVEASFAAPTHEDAGTVNRVAMPSFLSKRMVKSADVLTCSGNTISIQQRWKIAPVPFEQLVAARSTTKAGRAKKSYYGINIHALIDDANKETTKDKSKRAQNAEQPMPSVEQPGNAAKPRRTLMWTEKYRARHFMDLVGDDRTHRLVLRWLKAWDPLVFPKSGKAKPTAAKRPGAEAEEEKPHRKILLLTGPPGLGKTTLAHVCARQAGYEIMEINASDERSRDVVKGRIRTSVGTESVKTGSTITTKSGQVKKIAHPLCVVVDEVDGVVGGSGSSGEGGFIKALIDLILLDQKNSATVGTTQTKKKKKGDDFRLMRPLILICNDVYHPSLRPLRQSSFAEIIHVRKPPLDAVITRMKSVFEKEGVSCDSDAVRRLCEATWGVNATESRKGREGTGEGDLRGIMVVGEWAAGKLKASTKDGKARLTRKWVEQNMMNDLSHGGGGARGVGRGGVKEVVNRVFLEGAGFPKTGIINPVVDMTDDQPKTQLGVAELAKKAGMDRLREMVDTSGDIDRIVSDIFSEYPRQPFNDDSILSKPDAAYEWLHFHDTCSYRVFSGQDYELAPYLSQPVLACHHLFASPARHYFGGANEPKKWGEEEETEDPLPFTGPRADYEAHEAEKSNLATILALQASLNPTLLRSFRSPEDIATDLLPYLIRMLTPEIKPIIVGGSGDQRGIASVRKEAEKAMVKRSVDVMGAVGVIFERGKLEGEFGSRTTQWVYRMEP
jgi:chromosome transmission fidelity protein 18